MKIIIAILFMILVACDFGTSQDNIWTAEVKCSECEIDSSGLWQYVIRWPEYVNASAGSIYFRIKGLPSESNPWIEYDEWTFQTLPLWFFEQRMVKIEDKGKDMYKSIEMKVSVW